MFEAKTSTSTNKPNSFALINFNIINRKINVVILAAITRSYGCPMKTFHYRNRFHIFVFVWIFFCSPSSCRCVFNQIISGGMRRLTLFGLNDIRVTYWFDFHNVVKREINKNVCDSQTCNNSTTYWALADFYCATYTHYNVQRLHVVLLLLLLLTLLIFWPYFSMSLALPLCARVGHFLLNCR